MVLAYHDINLSHSGFECACRNVRKESISWPNVPVLECARDRLHLNAHDLHHLAKVRRQSNLVHRPELLRRLLISAPQHVADLLSAS